MTTEAQVNANRSNARKSTGPRTPRGKAAVAQNALKHGLRAQRDIVEGEDQEQFDLHRSRLLSELAPVTPMEDELAERIVRLTWRLRRADRIQDEAFDALLALQSQGGSAEMACSLLPDGRMKYDVNYGKFEPVLGEELRLGHAMVKDFSGTRSLERLQMYEQRIERSLFRTMRELEHLRLTGTTACAVMGGSTRAAGSGEGAPPSQQDHRQASLDDATGAGQEGVMNSVKQSQSEDVSSLTSEVSDGSCQTKPNCPGGQAPGAAHPASVEQSQSATDGAQNPGGGAVANKANRPKSILENRPSDAIAGLGETAMRLRMP